MGYKILQIYTFCVIAAIFRRAILGYRTKNMASDCVFADNQAAIAGIRHVATNIWVLRIFIILLQLKVNETKLTNKSKIKRIMAVVVKLAAMMAKRKISLGELAERVHITPANLSILKTGKARAIRFSTLDALCHELRCQPSDILEHVE